MELTSQNPNQSLVVLAAGAQPMSLTDAVEDVQRAVLAVDEEALDAAWTTALGSAQLVLRDEEEWEVCVWSSS